MTPKIIPLLAMLAGVVPAETRLPEPAAISPLARQIIRQRMDRHGDQLELLLAAVLMLNRPLVETLASDIAATPKLANLGGADGALLNATLPPRFFALQDQLGSQAKRLAEAARTRSDPAMAAAFGELTATCVKCHSVYLGDSPSPK